jgi:DNA-binding NtrC family response regulator
MRRRDEDNPRRIGASIALAPAWPAALARACRDAALAPAGTAVETVLRHMREAAGADRAFLLESDRAPAVPRVLAASVTRPDESTAFSRSVAARALHGERPLFLEDVRREPLWADGVSVRALSLRSALAGPVPAVDGRLAAVVLDSREPLTVDTDEGRILIGAFAGLVSLVQRAKPIERRRTRGPSASLVGASPAFVKLQDDIRSAAPVPLAALIVGESGSGKELVARALHDLGPRAHRPFVAINCAAIPEALLERELFGAMRGAFTGADRDYPGLFRQAEGGTVLLDEIGDMPLTLQAKLLRVIQEGTVRAVGALDEKPIDVRLIAATHRDLKALVADHRFRADLRWRLEVLVLRVPPLRERIGDLAVLSARLIERLAARCGLPPARLSPDATAQLAAHAWPGNVRELESVLARALLRVRAGVIEADDLELSPGPAPERLPRPARGAPGMERKMIEDALRATRGNMTAAALRIGWSRQALYRRIHALGLKDDRVLPEETECQDSSEAGGTKSSDNSTFQ